MMTQLQYYTTISYHLLFVFGVLGAIAFASAVIALLYVFGPYVGKR